jgi:hypothetical protein
MKTSVHNRSWLDVVCVICGDSCTDTDISSDRWRTQVELVIMPISARNAGKVPLNDNRIVNVIESGYVQVHKGLSTSLPRFCPNTRHLGADEEKNVITLRLRLHVDLREDLLQCI